VVLSHGCSSCHRSAQRLDDAPGRDVPGAAIYDVELLVVLVVTGLRVGVAVDDLNHPLGILELHPLVVALMGNVLLAFPLVGRCAIVVRLLLLLLTELLRELLDLLALLGAVAPRVVHQAPWPALITVGGLARLLVVTWVVAPTSRCCDSGDSGSVCQRLIVVVGLLLLPIFVLATALSSGIYFGLVGLPYLWGRLRVTCTPFCNPCTLVHQAEELRDVFHIVCDQLLEHLLISHAPSKSNYNISIGDARDGISNLGEPLDEGPQ
jgi:hypothetical protein